MTIHRQHFRPAPLAWFVAILLIFASNYHSVSGFAAKKKPNKKKNSASSNKGFGVAPPTLEEVNSKFRVRTPENAESLPCPCRVDNQLYHDCCQPYHKGEKFPESPLRLLQSRYSAFTYRLIPYIIQTTHPTCRDYRDNKILWAQDLNREGMFDSFEFKELNVLGDAKMEGDDRATISFQVRMRSKDGDQGETVVSETSVILRDPETNVWSYSTGDIRSEVAGLEDAVLNP